MLKILFWGLLLANGALFAFDRGFLGSLVSDGHEPTRMQNQLNAEKIRPSSVSPIAVEVPSAVIAPVADGSALSDSPVPAVAKPDVVACTEIGNFDAADARRFEKILVADAAGFQFTQRNVREAARHMVYIPSQGDKESADKKSSELKRLGIKDFYVIQDGAEMRWGISLGIFKTEDAARAHLANLSLKGVRSARIGDFSVTTNKVAFQVRQLDSAMKVRLDKIKADFPRQDVRACEPK